MEESILKAMSAAGGFAGVMCFLIAWFIGRRLLRVESALDRNTRLEAYRLTSSPHVSEEVRKAITEILHETEQAEKESNK